MEAATSEIIKYLDKIGEKVGAVGTEFWPLLVKEQYIEGIISTAAFFGAVFLAPVYFWWVVTKIDGFDGAAQVMIAFITVGVFVWCLVTVITFFCDGLSKLFVPEAYAIKALLRAARGG